jgi:DHA1 family multidrug resistance protein-like MFS transporter
VGFVQAAQILSAAVGPLAGGFLADRIGRRSTFFVTGALCTVALLLVVRFYEEPPRENTSAATPARSLSFLGVLGLPGVLSLLVVLFLVNFVGRSITPILPAHLERLGVPFSRLASSTGLVISAYAVMAALSAAAFGKATRGRSPLRLLAGSVLAGSLVLVPMAQVASFSTFLVFAVLLGLASGGALTLCYTLGGRLVPAEHKATAFGFFSAAALFGGSVSPSVAGLLAKLDLLLIYSVNAALFVVLGLALVLRPGRLHEAEGPPSAPLAP